MPKTIKEEALEALFGKNLVDRRFQPRTLLHRLGREFPDLMVAIATHVRHRVDEFGDDISAGRLLAVQTEAEILGLRAALGDEIIKQGLVSEDGSPNPFLTLLLRLNDQVLRFGASLGMGPGKNPTPSTVDPETDSEFQKAWAAALRVSPDPDTDTEPKSPAESPRQRGKNSMRNEPTDAGITAAIDNEAETAMDQCECAGAGSCSCGEECRCGREVEIESEYKRVCEIDFAKLAGVEVSR